MEIYIDPSFAYYEYMTLTYQNNDGAVLGITKMNRYGENYQQYVVDNSSNVSYDEVQGVKVGRVSDGYFAFRLTAAGNIPQDTTFNMVATFYDENGQPVLMSKLENEGIPAKEKRTEYTYNEDGTVNENITEYGKETIRTVKDGKVVSETIKEQGKTTEKAYDENGHTETVNDGKSTSTTTFNNENKKLSQKKVVDGQEYNVEYDGKGNTKVVLQNGESIEALAKKFGCTKQELLEANGGKIRGWAGDDVLVPGELEADDKRLQGRQTKEEAIEGYKKVAAEIEAVKNEAAARKPITFTNKDYSTYEELAGALFRREGIENPSKRQMEARIEDLKKTNPDLKDGELKGKRVTANVSEGMHERISGKEESAKEQSLRRDSQRIL